MRPLPKATFTSRTIAASFMSVLLLLHILLIAHIENVECLVSSRFRFEDLWRCPDRYPTLVCEDFDDLSAISLIARGTVKNVYLARWHNYPVVLSNLTIEAYRDDFQHNIAMHHLLDDGGYTVRMLGHCGDQIVTEFYPLGDLLRSVPRLSGALDVRFPLCIRYVEIIEFLHRHDRVMCDSSTLNKTLEQYVLSEQGSSIRLNDMDALPRKQFGIVRCGERMLDGDFVAPEQRWEVGYRKGYNEKTDVYKIPDVCEFILGDAEESLWFRYWLFDVHKSCKIEDVKRRPAARDVLREYRKIWNDYQTDIGVDYEDL